VPVLPICRCRQGGEDEEAADLDLSWMFAAYVNENHPFVDTLTREAIDAKVIDSFFGYQGEDADVLRQVYAIWHTLQQRGMRFSDISQSSAESPVVYSQHVRLFDEALAARQANCVDGTVVFASVLRKIGIEPYLVTLPGHMFLAFSLDEEGEQLLGLETTMMGSAPSPGAAPSRRIPAALARQLGARASFRSFGEAIDEGTAVLEKNRSKFEGDDPDYQLISLSEARQIGILPLAYRKK